MLIEQARVIAVVVPSLWLKALGMVLMIKIIRKEVTGSCLICCHYFWEDV